MRQITESNRNNLAEAVELYSGASKAVALTGAGISVESGIDDFRSPGGLWERFAPEEYATIKVFQAKPEKAWKLYREMGKSLLGKKPNPAHGVLAKLESQKLLHGVITQNIDNLHQLAGSKNVVEIHGNHGDLQCIYCGHLQSLKEHVSYKKNMALCPICKREMKPNVVLFGENVRGLDEISTLLYGCDLLLVVGTSAQVYPAAYFPEQVKQFGGKIFEFNTEKTGLSSCSVTGKSVTDFFFHGRCGKLLPLFYEALMSS